MARCWRMGISSSRNGSPKSMAPTANSTIINIAGCCGSRAKKSSPCGNITIKGIELDATVLVNSNLNFSFTGAYTKSKVDRLSNPTLTGAALTLEQITLPSPKFSGTVAGSWTLPVRPMDGALSVRADFYHTSEFAAQYGVKLPGYDVTNARLDWEDIRGTGLDLSVFVRNLFDKEYYTAAVVMIPGYATNTKYAGEPRTWGISAER